MWYKVEHKANDTNIALLVEAAHDVEPEFETVIRLAYQAGVKCCIGRHMGPEDLDGEELLIKHRLSKYVLRRPLDGELVQYLRKLTGRNTHYCPRLHALSTSAFANVWRDVRLAAGINIPMLALTHPYRERHRERLRFERARSYLFGVAQAKLSAAELADLLAREKKWTLMGPKGGNRHRRLTREQIMAPMAK